MSDQAPVQPLPLAFKVGFCAVGMAAMGLLWWALSDHDYTLREPPPIQVARYEDHPPSNDATERAMAMMRADPLTATTQRACLDAIDRANYASHHLSSEESISAQTAMLRTCEIGN